jgi:antitoxin FitA
MADILIRKLDDEVVEQLRERARRAGRSLEAEARLALTRSVKPDWDSIAALREKIGGFWENSADLIREDRDR